MRYIIGLGNPGQRYRHTRHNVGFMIVDRMAEHRNLTWKSGRGEYTQAQPKSGKFALVKPLTFMNRSGNAVQSLRRESDVLPSDMLVIYDDLDLPLGKIRFRQGGSAGTHLGMKDIIQKVQTASIPRLRIGIGSDQKTGPAEDFVLSPFTREEYVIFNDVIPEAVRGVVAYTKHDIKYVMNAFNRLNLA